MKFWVKGDPYLGYLITRRGIKPDPKKVKEIVDIRQPTTTTEVQALISMVKYYRDIFPRRYHILSHLIEADSGPKSRKYCGMTL